jgi:hypothetical protein
MSTYSQNFAENYPAMDLARNIDPSPASTESWFVIYLDSGSDEITSMGPFETKKYAQVWSKGLTHQDNDFKIIGITNDITHFNVDQEDTFDIDD